MAAKWDVPRTLPAIPDVPKSTKLDAILSDRADTPSRGIPAVYGGNHGKHKRWQSSGTKSGECFRILPDGTKVPFVSPKAERQRKATTKIVQQDNARKLISKIKLDHDYNAQ